jgi:transcriptional regulator with XRE-family HTH domain
VHKLEEGRRSTSLKTLYRLADALKVPVSSLLADSPYAASGHSLGATPRLAPFPCAHADRLKRRGRNVNVREQIFSMCESHDPAVGYLAKLSVELSGQGIISELISTGCMPRLHLEDIPWGTREALANSEFEDNILAVMDTDGTWQFWWPWIEPIGPADDPAGAAARIFQAILDILTPEYDIEAGDKSTV